VSTVKHPKEKKQLSLDRDCRNVHGENPAASRKGIRKGKQHQHMNERRSAAQALARFSGSSDDDLASDVESKAKVASAVSRKYGFRKIPDIPLGDFLDRKRKWKEAAPQRKGETKKH
jgi:hypothetical protein